MNDRFLKYLVVGGVATFGACQLMLSNAAVVTVNQAQFGRHSTANHQQFSTLTHYTSTRVPYTGADRPLKLNQQATFGNVSASNLYTTNISNIAPLGSGLYLRNSSETSGTRANYYLTAGISGYSQNSLALFEKYDNADIYHLTTYQTSLFLGGRSSTTSDSAVTILNAKGKTNYLVTPSITGGTATGAELTLKGSSGGGGRIIASDTIYGNFSGGTVKASIVPTWVPSVCGEDPLRPAVYDGAPGANAVFCNLSGGTRSVIYDENGLNPSSMSAFAVHLFEGSNEVTPLYWSWVTGGASNRIYGSGTESTFTPSVKPSFSSYSSNNYIQAFATYSSLYGRRVASCGTPITVARLFKGYSGAQGTDGITWDFVVGSVTKLAAGGTPFVTYSTSGATEKTVNYGLVTGDTGSAASITEASVIDAFQASTSNDYLMLKATSGTPEKFRVYDASDNVRLEITSTGLIVVKDASGNTRFGFDTTSNSLYMKRGAATVFSVSSTGQLTL